jgi:hypothetical protein
MFCGRVHDSFVVGYAFLYPAVCGAHGLGHVLYEGLVIADIMKEHGFRDRILHVGLMLADFVRADSILKFPFLILTQLCCLSQ